MATSPTTSDVSPVAPPESGLFLRKATGLVRELSVWDAFNINLTGGTLRLRSTDRGLHIFRKFLVLFGQQNVPVGLLDPVDFLS